MFKISIIFLSLIFSSYAGAEQTIKSQIVAAEKSINEIESRRSHLQDKLKSFEAKLVKAKKGKSESYRNITMLEIYNDEIESLETEIVKAEKAIIATSQQIEYGLMRKKTIDSLHRGLTNLIQVQGLTTELSQVSRKVGSTEDALDEIRDRFDQAIIGAYIQDKVGALLNSRSLCKAAKQCVNSSAPTVSSKDISAELFPTSEPSAYREDHKSKKATAVK